MESWSYVCGSQGFVSDDTVSETGGISRSSNKNGMFYSEFKPPWSFGSTTMICSSHEEEEGVVENQDFIELGSSDMERKSLPNESIGDILGGKISPFSGEDESTCNTTKLSSSSSSSSLIDLKLGRLNDHRDVKSLSFSKANPLKPSSAESSVVPAKRARGGGFSPQTAYCQVHGCRKDLSCSKDYHKRHKVCEVHSKTSKVIVNGIEKRFCQQCSRFHLLDEFDDGKRSCRKRLAGHNERRRKPQMRVPTGRVGRFFQSFNAIGSQGNAFQAPSFVCRDTLPTGSLMPLQKCETVSSPGLLKLEDGADFPATNDAVLPLKSLFAPHDTSSRNKIGTNSSPYLEGIAVASDFASQSAYHDSSVGEDEGMTVLDSSSAYQELSDMSNSGRAHSLLSSQSQSSSSNHSSGVHALYAITQQPPEKLLGLNSQTPPGSGISTMFHPSLPSSVDCSTINLLQLSSQLQRVEHQRGSLLMKQEDDDDDDYSGLRIT